MNQFNRKGNANPNYNVRPQNSRLSQHKIRLLTWYLKTCDEPWFITWAHVTLCTRPVKLQLHSQDQPIDSLHLQHPSYWNCDLWEFWDFKERYQTLVLPFCELLVFNHLEIVTFEHFNRITPRFFTHLKGTQEPFPCGSTLEFANYRDVSLANVQLWAWRGEPWHNLNRHTAHWSCEFLVQAVFAGKSWINWWLTDWLESKMLRIHRIYMDRI